MDQSVPTIRIQSSIVTTNSDTCTWMSFSFLLGSHIPRWPATCYLRLQNPKPSCCHCHFLHVAHRHPYSPLSRATSPHEASTTACLCGCLPHATWALTSSSRPPWAMSCLPYLCSAMLCWVATTSQPCADSSPPCTAHLMALGLDYFERKKRREGSYSCISHYVKL